MKGESSPITPRDHSINSNHTHVSQLTVTPRPSRISASPPHGTRAHASTAVRANAWELSAERRQLATISCPAPSHAWVMAWGAHGTGRGGGDARKWTAPTRSVPFVSSSQFTPFVWVQPLYHSHSPHGRSHTYHVKRHLTSSPQQVTASQVSMCTSHRSRGRPK